MSYDGNGLLPPIPANFYNSDQSLNLDAIAHGTPFTVAGSGLVPLPSGPIPSGSGSGSSGGGNTGPGQTTNASDCTGFDLACYFGKLAGRAGALILGLVLIAGALYIFANSQNLIPKGVPLA